MNWYNWTKNVRKKIFFRKLQKKVYFTLKKFLLVQKDSDFSYRRRCFVASSLLWAWSHWLKESVCCPSSYPQKQGAPWLHNVSSTCMVNRTVLNDLAQQNHLCLHETPLATRATGADPCRQRGPAVLLSCKVKEGKPSEGSETAHTEIAFDSIW